MIYMARIKTQQSSILLLLLSLFLPVAGLAQGGGTITGRVFDQTQAVIPGVGIEMLRTGATEHVEILTDGDGMYRFDNLPPGPVELTFRLINFSTIRRNVVVTAGSTATVDVVLVVSASADITITEPLTFRNLAELENPAENLVGVASAGS